MSETAIVDAASGAVALGGNFTGGSARLAIHYLTLGASR
jgi:hypothetical protein